MSAYFPTDPAESPLAASAPSVELEDGDVFDLELAPVSKRLDGSLVRMLAYNGSIPGPTLRLRQGSTVKVRVTNRGDYPTTVHWHGLRLENRFDGTHHTQAAIPVGESFTYEVSVPDAGVYWYHPHVREDHGQELGLYGNIVVEPAEADYWPPAHRELAVTLDDVLVEDGQIRRFAADGPDHVAMGRFGNVMLVNGETDLQLSARPGEVVRFYLTNTANTRVFNLALPGATLKLVGGDSGRVEQETFVEELLIAPSERLVVDARFAAAGELVLEHRTPARVYPLATIRVGGPVATELPFDVLRENPEMAAERARIAPFLAARPDKSLAFVAEMHLDAPATAYVCPMHPEVTSHEPSRCPECGMKLVPGQMVTTSHAHHAMPRSSGRIEWEDDMVEVNRLTTPANTRWKLVEPATGAANGAIDWRFRVGQQVKLRLVTERDSDHPMPHPFHVHGAGRFLVLARDGVVEPNLVWKDTVLVKTDETVDVLLEVANPGDWMAHCHIAEHHEAGMMLHFRVDPA
jgi:FtsP/CotA-like multicopper oxidase with cupredoxin domain